MNWLTGQDGYVITAKMSDQEVWLRCQLFGAPRLAEAIEIWLEIIERTIEGKNENQTMVSELVFQERPNLS